MALPLSLRLLPLLLAGGLTACASVGPDYRAPAVAVPPAWQAPSPDASASPQSLANWWEQLADPQLSALVADALAARLAQLDPAGAAVYKANHARFSERWKAAMARWEQAAAPLKGVPVWVQHRSFPYLADWLGLRELGALEPKPGVEPGSSHLAALLERQRAQPARMILRPAYTRATASDWLGERAQIPVVVLPFTVGGSAEAGDLFPLLEKGRLHERQLIELGDVITGRRSGRGSPDEITLFESQGMAIQDLAVALRVVQAAEAQGFGTQLPY